jgi:hypothetical protein
MLREGAAERVIAEIVRVLRPGGRIAVNHMLCQLKLRALADVRVDHPNAYTAVEAAFRHDALEPLEKKFWAQSQRIEGKPLYWMKPRFLPRLIDPLEGRRFPEVDEPTADVYLTMVATKRSDRPPRS